VLVNLYSILIAIPLGLAFGIYAALKKNKWQDNFISTMVMVFISVPSYVYAFLVQYFLCFKLGWFPLQAASLSQAGGSLFSWTMFVSLIPAVLSLGFGVVAGLTRYTRAELSEVLTGDYMLLARTKGLTKAQAIWVNKPVADVNDNARNQADCRIEHVQRHEEIIIADIDGVDVQVADAGNAVFTRMSASMTKSCRPSPSAIWATRGCASARTSPPLWRSA